MQRIGLTFEMVANLQNFPAQRPPFFSTSTDLVLNLPLFSWVVVELTHLSLASTVYEESQNPNIESRRTKRGNPIVFFRAQKHSLSSFE